MAWISLFIAGLLEIVWAYFMKQSAGFTRIVPSIACLLAMFASFGLLAFDSSWNFHQRNEWIETRRLAQNPTCVLPLARHCAISFDQYSRRLELLMPISRTSFS